MQRHGIVGRVQERVRRQRRPEQIRHVLPQHRQVFAQQRHRGPDATHRLLRCKPTSNYRTAVTAVRIGALPHLFRRVVLVAVITVSASPPLPTPTLTTHTKHAVPPIHISASASRRRCLLGLRLRFRDHVANRTHRANGDAAAADESSCASRPLSTRPTRRTSPTKPCTPNVP